MSFSTGFSTGFSKSYVQQKDMCDTGPSPLTPAFTSVQMFLPPSNTLPYKPIDCYGSYFRPINTSPIEYIDQSQYKTTPQTTKFPPSITKCQTCSK